MSRLEELASDVLNGIENCMDRSEDRTLTGGPTPAGAHVYNVHLDGEDFVIIIARKPT